MRLDVYLTENQLAKSRTKAAEYISGGFVRVNGSIVFKPARDVLETDTVELLGKPYDYVGRGGVKLEGALDRFKINVVGATACDVGASSGGFTDCLLKRGALKVYAIDSGRDQLDPTLRKDRRVVSIEGFNARNLCYDVIRDRCGIIVSDLSFISQTYIIPALPGIAEKDALLVSLIKPQFECGREALNKNGVVRDKRFHAVAIRRVLACATENGFSPVGLMKSVITGGDGNVEYMFAARMDGGRNSTIDEDGIRGVLREEN